MTEPFSPDEVGVTPAIEVTAYRDGEVIRRELCESDEEATAVIDRWSELDGVECQVDDLSVRHRPPDVLEPSESELGENNR